MMCGECHHYEPARNPETHRPLPSQPGHCRYPVSWPILPKAFLAENMWNHTWSIELPRRRPIEKDDSRECKVFAEKQQKRKAERT